MRSDRTRGKSVFLGVIAGLVMGGLMIGAAATQAFANTPIKLVSLEGHYKKSFTFDKDIDAVWKAVVQVLEDYTKTTIEKDSGLMVTEFMETRSNPEYLWVKDFKKDTRPAIFSVEKEFYNENKKSLVGLHPRGLHSFRVRLSTPEAGKTTVSVKCKEKLNVDHRRPGGTEPGYGVSQHLPLSLWIGTKDIESMGYKEHKFLEAVGELIGIEVPPAPDPIDPYAKKKKK